MTSPTSRLPSISIVTPNHNGADFLDACLSSVVNQDVDGLEYIVVDGASEDASAHVIAHYAASICTLIQEPDAGHANALNKGFRQSNGEIMGWINSDDMLFDGALRFVQEVFDAYPEVEWITGRASSMNEAGAVTSIAPARPWSRLRFLAGDHFWIQQESTFWRRSLWERAGGRLDETLSLANDFELWARFFRHAELHTVDRHLGCFRVRDGQRSVTHKQRYIQEVRDVLSRELAVLTPADRRTLGRLVPEAPVELSAADARSLAAELGVFDPPFIRPRQVRAARKSQHARPNTRITPDMVRASDLGAFRDKHKGERCFILGNGPSLNETDLSLLKDEVVFACNAAFLLFDRIDWRPTYYTCVDSRVLPDRAADIDAMLKAHPEMTAFFPTVIENHGEEKRRTPVRSLIPPDANRHYFTERHSSVANLPWSMFSLDAQSHVVQPHTVAITMLQLAAFMGFDEIYLVGCDTSYSVSTTVHRGGKSGRDLSLTSTRDDDANHFDPTYFGAGRKWHVPNVQAMMGHYKQARDALEQAGVSVFNATKGGALEVFDRVALEAVFDPARKPPPLGKPGRAAPEKPDGPLPSRTGASASMLRTLCHNTKLITGTGAGLLAICAGILFAPGIAVKISVFAIGTAAAASVLAGAVALKSRRIILGLVQRVESQEEQLAQLELDRVELDARISELETELDRVDQPTDRG
jgi:hypothetical protein